MKILLQGLFTAYLLLSCIKASDTPKKNSDEARCTGSSNCAACSNCTRCAHCSSGGSCGVCRGSSSGRSGSAYHVHSKKKKTTSLNKPQRSAATSASGPHSRTANVNRIYPSNSAIIYGSGTIHVIKRNGVNVRKRPNLNSEIIEKLQKGSKFTIIEYVDLWYKIKVVQSGKTGYIHNAVMK